VVEQRLWPGDSRYNGQLLSSADAHLPRTWTCLSKGGEAGRREEVFRSDSGLRDSCNRHGRSKHDPEEAFSETFDVSFFLVDRLLRRAGDEGSRVGVEVKEAASA